jgi:hypothetical protein
MMTGSPVASAAGREMIARIVKAIAAHMVPTTEVIRSPQASSMLLNRRSNLDCLATTAVYSVWRLGVLTYLGKTGVVWVTFGFSDYKSDYFLATGLHSKHWGCCFSSVKSKGKEILRGLEPNGPRAFGQQLQTFIRFLCSTNRVLRNV